MPKKDETKTRNWVKKAADELGLKPARFKDRKHDYDRSERRVAERKWDETGTTIPRARGKGLRPKHVRPDQDWSGDYEGELDRVDRLESAEDSPDTGEVQ